jgi:hypothetical protein
VEVGCGGACHRKGRVAMQIFFMALAVLVGLAVLAVLLWFGMEWLMDGELFGWVFIAGAAVLLAGGIAFIASGDSDPYANRLCLRGHQEWRTEQGAPILVGKVIVPGTPHTRKVWVCDQWEAR